MTARMSSWLVPIVGTVIGLLLAVALLGRSAGPVQVALSFAIVVGYALGVHALRTRSDLASVLSGTPPDERWSAINLQALSVAAQILALALVIAYLATTFGGGDATAYAWTGALFGASYLGGLAWYRRRS
jgi:hypothetical protein